MYSARKAIAAAILACSGAFVTAVEANSDVDQISVVGWILVVVTTIGTGAGTFAIDNNVGPAKTK